jgi:hypothetical protein
MELRRDRESIAAVRAIRSAALTQAKPIVGRYVTCSTFVDVFFQFEFERLQSRVETDDRSVTALHDWS